MSLRFCRPCAGLFSTSDCCPHCGTEGIPADLRVAGETVPGTLFPPFRLDLETLMPAQTSGAT